jgi:hypothetical protein
MCLQVSACVTRERTGSDGLPELTASLASLGPVAWVKLSNEDVRFTVIPDQGSSVWA